MLDECHRVAVSAFARPMAFRPKVFRCRFALVHFLAVELFPALLAIGSWVALVLGISEAVTVEHAYEGLHVTHACVRSRVAQMLLSPQVYLPDPRACPSVASSAPDDRSDDEMIAEWTIWACRCTIYAPVLLLLTLVVCACSAFSSAGTRDVGSASYVLFCLQLRHRRTYRVLARASVRVVSGCLGIGVFVSVVPTFSGGVPLAPIWAAWRGQVFNLIALFYAGRSLAKPAFPLHPWLASAEFEQIVFRRTWAQVLTEASDVLCLRLVDALWRAQHAGDCAALEQMLVSPCAKTVLDACKSQTVISVERKALDDASSFANLALPGLLPPDALDDSTTLDDATILNDPTLPQLLPPETIELSETVGPGKTFQDKSEQQEIPPFQTPMPLLLTRTSELASAFRVIFAEGLVVRSGLELTTPQVARLAFGETFEAWGRVVNEEGTGRLLTRLGWVSERGAPGSPIEEVWLVAALDAEDPAGASVNLVDLPALRAGDADGGPSGPPELRSALSLLAAERARAARLELHLAEEQLARATAEARLRSLSGASFPPVLRQEDIEDVTRIKL